MARIAPAAEPYESEVAERLAAMMPPGVPPILLFRTLVQNLPMAEAMGEWGPYELSKRLSLSMRDREIVIDRTCVRCGCEYEWGVHVVVFAERVGFTPDQMGSIVHGTSADPCWTDDRERLLLDAADALHERSTIDDELWSRLASTFSDAQLLDLLFLCGWYHAISYAANAAQVDLEPAAPRFTDYLARQ